MIEMCPTVEAENICDAGLSAIGSRFPTAMSPSRCQSIFRSSISLLYASTPMTWNSLCSPETMTAVSGSIRKLMGLLGWTMMVAVARMGFVVSLIPDTTTDNIASSAEGAM